MKIKKETYVEKLLLKYKDKWYISKIVLKVLEDLKYFIAKLLILNFQYSRKNTSLILQKIIIFHFFTCQIKCSKTWTEVLKIIGKLITVIKYVFRRIVTRGRYLCVTRLKLNEFVISPFSKNSLTLLHKTTKKKNQTRQIEI